MKPNPAALVAAVAGFLVACASTSDPPRAYQELCDRGEEQLVNGDYGKARGTFRDILARYPRQAFNSEVELLLSDCERKVGNEAEARRLREKVAGDPAASLDLKMRASFGLGKMDLEAERFAEAAARFRDAYAAAGEASADERATLLCHAGIALQSAGRFAEARDAFQKAIGEAPASPAAKQAKVQLLYPDHFAVQTGAFREAANAERQRALLAEKGYPAEVVAVDLPQGTYRCVRVGKFRDRSQARALLEKIRAARVLPATAKLAVKP